MGSNLIIDEGYKEYTINGDPNRVIRFNPNDYSLVERINEVYKRQESAEELKSLVKVNLDGSPANDLPECAEAIRKVNKFIKEDIINYLFNADVADVVFGKQSPLSMVKGKPFYERFLEVVIPEIKEEIEAEQKAAQKRIQKYTKVVK
jgi:hypothetical protein